MLPVDTEVDRGCEEEGVPLRMLATSEAILETSSELSVEADGAVVRLVSLEEGPGSSIEKNETLISVNRNRL